MHSRRLLLWPTDSATDSLSCSLGGVESLVERRAQYAEDAKRGSPPNLLRLSVGLEHVEDIWADIVQALNLSQEL